MITLKHLNNTNMPLLKRKNFPGEVVSLLSPLSRKEMSRVRCNYMFCKISKDGCRDMSRKAGQKYLDTTVRT